MIELLGLFFGGLFRLFPSLIEAWNKKRDQEHELAMLDRQMRYEQLRAAEKRAEIALQTEGRVEGGWADALSDAIRAQGMRTGVGFIDGLNASVRPVLTYWWCLILYTAAKVITIYLALSGDAELEAIAEMLVTPFDRSVIGSIFGFWFVDRALRKYSGR